ncbi:unnamed protein product [Paramecium primaurelia]|uniref:Zinc-finger domain-containing protein n=1 Tax=Paramecium primaurelia TaxID=5886 RepID=A0A8S1KTU0_PARPR|nr:unnamed protein product [Paramecium primaurelia]
MDKSVESLFTSDFWREVNQQFFMVESPISLNVQKKIYKKSSNLPSVQTQEWIDKTLISLKKSESQLQKLNDNNVRVHLSLLLMQREKSFEPIQELINEMIDKICEKELRDRLESNKILFQNMYLLPLEKQMEILQQEASILSNLQQKIDLPDQLQQVIMELEDDLIKVQDRNTKQINNLAKHLEEINRNLLYQYTIKQTGQFALRIQRIRVQHHQNELENLEKLIIHYQDYQVADSIGKAIYNSETNLVSITFDKYLSKTPIDFKFDQFQNFQRLREIELELNVQQQYNQDESQTIVSIKTEMCHCCRQMIEITDLQQCKYNHVNMKLQQQNEEILIQQRYAISQKQMQQFYIDLYSTNYIIENNQIQCQKYFCFKCLQYEFKEYDISGPNWICPQCKGQCFCIRCQRNDSIQKLKRTFLEIGGNFDSLYQQSIFEILVENKRKLIQNIPIDFFNIKKFYSENEETLTSKGLFKNKNKNKINKKIKKQKSSETTIVGKTQSILVDTSSSSIKIKKIKVCKPIISKDSIVFVQ